MPAAQPPPPQPTTNASVPECTAIGLQHAAIIMDGNRRWAKENDLPTIAGHNAGLQSLKRLIEHVGPAGLQVLTVYAFSTENWQRQASEVDSLMDLFATALVDELMPLHEQNVQVRFLGNPNSFSKPLQAAMASMVNTTKHNTGLILNVAMNYGGRDEVLRAANAAIKAKPTQPLTEEALTAHLDTADCVPPDMVIRTGGEQRLSNFLLWQAAYAELVFVDTLWPEFTPTVFGECATEFANRHRRYGV